MYILVASGLESGHVLSIVSRAHFCVKVSVESLSLYYASTSIRRVFSWLLAASILTLTFTVLSRRHSFMRCFSFHMLSRRRACCFPGNPCENSSRGLSIVFVFRCFLMSPAWFEHL
ncbi:hypothetical protein BDW62DRAFT_73029 [Aspergillus aurantiobrunneus]